MSKIDFALRIPLPKEFANKARTEVTMNDVAGEKITWVGEHVGTA